MSKHRLHRIKGWCGINDNSILPISIVWKKLDTVDNKSDKLSLLNQLFSTCETGHDQLDLVITERLGQAIINCNLGAGLGYSYANCHHGLTIFSTAPQSTEFVAAQLMEEENLREATHKSVSDIRAGKGKPPALATGYYSLLAWFNNYIAVLQILFGLQCTLLISMKRLRTVVVTIRRRNSSYFTRSNITNLLWRIFIDGRSYFSIQTDKEDLQNNNLPVSTLDTTMAIVAQGTALQYDDLPVELRARTGANDTEKRPGSFAASAVPKKPKNDNSKKELIFQDLYHPIIQRAMTPVLAKVKFFSIKEFLRRAKVNPKDLVNSDNNVCTRLLLLGKCFDGCRGRHVKVSDSWAKKVAEKLKPALDNSLAGN